MFVPASDYSGQYGRYLHSNNALYSQELSSGTSVMEQDLPHSVRHPCIPRNSLQENEDDGHGSRVFNHLHGLPRATMGG